MFSVKSNEPIAKKNMDNLKWILELISQVWQSHRAFCLAITLTKPTTSKTCYWILSLFFVNKLSFSTSLVFLSPKPHFSQRHTFHFSKVTTLISLELPIENQKMASHLIFLCLILFSASHFLVINCTEFEVGGKNGWVVPNSKDNDEMYNQWASQNRFKIDDIIRKLPLLSNLIITHIFIIYDRSFLVFNFMRK